MNKALTVLFAAAVAILPSLVLSAPAMARTSSSGWTCSNSLTAYGGLIRYKGNVKSLDGCRNLCSGKCRAFTFDKGDCFLYQKTFGIHENMIFGTSEQTLCYKDSTMLTARPEFDLACGRKEPFGKLIEDMEITRSSLEECKKHFKDNHVDFNYILVRPSVRKGIRCQPYFARARVFGKVYSDLKLKPDEILCDPDYITG